MDVKFSDNLTNSIKHLRETVYPTSEFTQEFSDRLAHEIYATDVQYTPEQFGGWSVEVTVNTDKCIEDNIIGSQESSSYIRKVTTALSEALHRCTLSENYTNMASNLSNVVITGPDTLVVKL